MVDTATNLCAGIKIFVAKLLEAGCFHRIRRAVNIIGNSPKGYCIAIHYSIRRAIIAIAWLTNRAGVAVTAHPIIHQSLNMCMSRKQPPHTAWNYVFRDFVKILIERILRPSVNKENPVILQSIDRVFHPLKLFAIEHPSLIFNDLGHNPRTRTIFILGYIAIVIAKNIDGVK